MTEREWDGAIHASEIHAFDSPCRRRYWFRYGGSGDPLPEQGNLRLGSAVHAIHEGYLESGEIRTPVDTIHVDYRVGEEERVEKYTPEDQVALAQLSWAHLPSPGEGFAEVPFRVDYEGIEYAGTIDYLHGSKRLVIDHKTTSNLRWAKTTMQLVTDPQPLLYGLAVQQVYGPGVVEFLWSYTQTRGRRAWRGISFTLMSQEIRDGVRTHLAPKAREILAYHTTNPDPLSLSPEPSECQAYNRVCPYRARCTDVTDLQIVLAIRLKKEKYTKNGL